jgi:hypothetical protein
MDGHAPLDAPNDGAPFVLGKVMTGLGAEQEEDLLEIVRLLFNLGGDRRGSSKCMCYISEKLSGHLLW